MKSPPQNLPPEELLTAKQVAERMNRSVEWVYYHSQRGRLPGYKVEGGWLYRPSEIDDYLRARSNQIRPQHASRAEKPARSRGLLKQLDSQKLYESWRRRGVTPDPQEEAGS